MKQYKILTMTRKKWTAKEEITDEVLKFREKRKWQQALRRYVLDKNISEGYAVYFGLSIERFREWIETQFTEGLSWDGFGSNWQFDHILPIAYFDFNNDADLRLCWNFLNIRVDNLLLANTSTRRIDILAAKTYFELLSLKTGAVVCTNMLEKIKQIEALSIAREPAIETFLLNRKEEIELTASLSQEEFAYLNRVASLKDIVLERALLKKFG